MKDNKSNFFIAFIIIYILFGFFPGVKIDYVSPIKFLMFRPIDYLIRNFFHLWKIKLIVSIGAVFISYIIKEQKIKKYNRGDR
ncbi:hypothetical protein CIW83_20125 [Tissierella sp. P1]|uniref:hypothetical protein n=1 Tax=unclassified Tissierella TaxID=2638726 RepID=UPI000B9F9CF0|nr:hypothetical protein [Tissierella sp. P1]OZV10483.1 hypothetical protein CIW83_20125 [Tissierella sp. P1]